jgi:hypothetical protein
MVVRVHWQAMLVVCRMHWRRRLRSGFRGVLTPLWLPLQLVDIIHPNLPPVKREIVAAELAKVRYSRRNEFGRRRFPFSPPWVMVPRDVQDGRQECCCVWLQDRLWYVKSADFVPSFAFVPTFPGSAP